MSIVTLNGTHSELTKAAFNAGIYVICVNPLFFTTAEALEIETLTAAKGPIVGVTYGFSGHPLLMQMRAMNANGEIGDVRMVDERLGALHIVGRAESWVTAI